MRLHRTWFNRKSVILTWLGSYIAVMLVPILFSLTVYWVAERTIENRIRESNRLILLQMKDSLDHQVDTIKKLTSQIYANVTLHSLFYSHKFERGQYRYDLFQLSRDFRTYKSIYNDFYEFYVYWAPADLGIFSSIYKSGEYVHSDLYRNGTLSLEDWRKVVDSTQYRKILLTNQIDDQDNQQHYINYITALPSDDNQNPVGSIVVMIDTQKMFRMIDNVRELSDSTVFILNEQHQNLLPHSDVTDLSIPTEYLSEESGNITYRFQERDSQLSYIHSSNSGLTYLVITPDEVIWKEVTYLRILIIFCVAASLLAGTMLTIVFLRRDYKPLQKLLKSLALQSNREIEPLGNEYQFLQYALSTTLDEKEKIQIRLKQQQHQLQANVITRLLKGKFEAVKSDQADESSLPLDFVSEHFSVLLIYLEDSEHFFEITENMTASESFHLLQFIVSNIFEELFNRQHRAWMLEIDDMMVCLINLESDDTLSNTQALIQITEEAQQFVQTKFYIELTASISSVHSLSNVPAAYKEALYAMEYRLVKGKGGIIAYEYLSTKAPVNDKEGYYFPIYIEQKWINCIKIGDAEEAFNILDELIDRNFKQTTLPVEFTKCLIFDIVSTLIKTIQDIKAVHGAAVFESSAAIESILSAATVDEIQSKLSALLHEVCGFTAALHEQNKTKNRRDELISLSEEIIRFIEQNYSDFNLNVSYIGEHFDMKATYLSKLFKDQTGESLLDYISSYRVEQSKQLLRESKLTLQEVAQQCGFGEIKTFIRTFKKLEGITPGKYKVMD